MRTDEFAARLSDLTGQSLEEAKSEVELSVRRLFHWASYADKFGGTVQETQLYGTVIKIHEPVIFLKKIFVLFFAKKEETPST